MEQQRGQFITLEGGDGAGKSTQARAIKSFLEERGLTVMLTREPGGSEGAELIRSLLVQGSADRWDPLTEYLLFSAARRDHLTKTIWPALQAGIWVVCDRFYDSSCAYQGAGRGLDSQALASIYKLIAGDFKPDLTFLLDLPPQTGLARVHNRTKQQQQERQQQQQQQDRPAHQQGRAMDYAEDHPAPEGLSAPKDLFKQEDRFEQMALPVHERIRRAFLAIAAREPGRCVVIDAAVPVEDVTRHISRHLEARLALLCPVC